MPPSRWCRATILFLTTLLLSVTAGKRKDLIGLLDIRMIRSPGFSRLACQFGQSFKVKTLCPLYKTLGISMNRHHALERVPTRLTLLFTQRQFSSFEVATLMIMKHLDIYCGCHCSTYFDVLVLQCAHAGITSPGFVGFVVKRQMKRSGKAYLLTFFFLPCWVAYRAIWVLCHFRSHAASLASSHAASRSDLLLPSPDEKGGVWGIGLAAQPH